MSERDGKSRRERIRANIRDYYDFVDASAGAGAAAAAAVGSGRANSTGRAQSPKEGNEVDIDSEHFSVSKYTTALLREQSLRGLYETDTKLRRSVRELDGELQSLVYDNYSRFITATDTIRQMRDNVADMDTKLQALSSNVESIDRVASSISGNLQSHRAKIEQMLVTNQMLRKIQFLVELPEALGHFTSKDKLHVAVKYWVAGDAILQKHSHITSFHRTHDECRQLALTLVESLKTRIKHANLGDKEAVQATREAIEDLRLLHHTSIFPNKASTDAEQIEKDTLQLMLSHIYADFKVEVSRAREAVYGVFAAADIELKRLLGAEPDVTTRSVRKQLADTFRSVQLELFFQSVRNGATKFKNQVETSLDLAGRLDPKDLGARVTAEIQPLMLEVVEELPKRIAGYVQGACEVVIRVAALPVDSPAHITSSEAKQLVADIMVNAGLLLKGFELNSRVLGGEFLRSFFDHTAQFNRLVDEALVSVFASLLEFLSGLDRGVPPPDHEETENVAGVLANGDNVTAHGVRLLVAALLARGVPRYAFAELSSGDDALDRLLGPIHAQFTEISRRLVQRFVVAGAAAASERVRVAFLRASVHRCMHEEPVAPSVYVSMLVNAWAGAFEKLSEWFPKIDRQHDTSLHASTPSNATSGCSGTHSRGASGATGRGNDAAHHHGHGSRPIPVFANFQRRDHHSLASDVDRMFSRRAHGLPLRPATIDCHCILAAFVASTLRSLLDDFRELIFTPEGFRQLQVDLAVFLDSLSTNNSAWFLGKCDEGIIVQVHEMAAAAFERCTPKPSPMTPAAIEAVVRAAAH